MNETYRAQVRLFWMLCRVEWKLLNIGKLKQSNPAKHAKTIAALDAALSGDL